MQTIKTRVLPCTNTKPTRIKATASAALGSVILSASVFDTFEAAHRIAAMQLIKKLDWPGTWIAGDDGKGLTWVCLKSEPTLTV